jgi:hypothetical protein
VTGEDTGFVLALHIGSFSVRLVFGRRSQPRAETRRQRRQREQQEREASNLRNAEIARLMYAQTIINNARRVA